MTESLISHYTILMPDADTNETIEGGIMVAQNYLVLHFYFAWQTDAREFRPSSVAYK